MTASEFVLSRMQELDEWRWNGFIRESDYQELSAYWRRILLQLAIGTITDECCC